MKSLPSLSKKEKKQDKETHDQPMTFTLNDTLYDFPISTLSEALDACGFVNQEGVAIAVNQQVIPKELWTSTPIEQGYSILVIVATQGG
ncbi:MAG: thiamine biosynthesis protein ThiS [Flavobacteriaceae bacterium]|nr:MAG: thiamine biosynthesis protein ThiS [Flavobacteriaceae bacterium]